MLALDSLIKLLIILALYLGFPTSKTGVIQATFIKLF